MCHQKQRKYSYIWRVVQRPIALFSGVILLYSTILSAEVSSVSQPVLDRAAQENSQRLRDQQAIQNACPFSPGELISLRAMEQGLDNLNRHILLSDQLKWSGQVAKLNRMTVLEPKGSLS